MRNAKEEKQVTLLDGAWGTRLQAMGLRMDEEPSLWNLTHPELVEFVARAYVDAGSEIILTNTFGASRVGVESEAVVRAGAGISVRCAGHSAQVYGSIGPTGRSLGREDLPPAEVMEVFRRQAVIMAESGVHGIAVETMIGLGEAVLALKAAREAGLPVVISMVFGLPESAWPRHACEVLADAGAAAIGVNCMSGRECVRACRDLREATQLPIWINPNAGVPQRTASGWVYPFQPPEFAALAVSLAESGADYIGGCCGTTEEHIKAAAEALGRRASR